MTALPRFALTLTEVFMSREFLMPRYVVTGENALEGAAKYFSIMGKKALIITGTVTAKSACFSALESALDKAGVAHAAFSDIHGEPDDIVVNAALSAYRENGCDCFAAIGGGSALDTMKAAAVLAAKGGRISDFLGKQIEGRLPFMAAIPTTAGTGSEATRFTVITDTATDVKMLISGAALIPDLAVVDPEFTVSAPKSITAATGLDALTHAVESFTSKKAQPLTDSAALSAVKRIFKNLPAAYKNGGDISARSEMCMAALEAGIAINNASVTIVHGMSRPIGAYFHVPHGISNAMLLEKCLGFALDGNYPRFAELGRAVGAADFSDNDKTASEKFIGAVGELCAVCEIPTLEGYGIDRGKFFGVIDKMAQDAVASGSPANTVKPVLVDDVKNIYRSLWD